MDLRRVRCQYQGLGILTAAEKNFDKPLIYAAALLSVLTRRSGRQRRSIPC